MPEEGVAERGIIPPSGEATLRGELSISGETGGGTGELPGIPGEVTTGTLSLSTLRPSSTLEGSPGGE